MKKIWIVLVFFALGFIVARGSETNISSEANQNETSSFVGKVTGHPVRVDGYFVHYGNGAFDWAYIPNRGLLGTNVIYKLEGMDKDGYFLWTPGKIEDGSVVVIDGTVFKSKCLMAK